MRNYAGTNYEPAVENPSDAPVEAPAKVEACTPQIVTHPEAEKELEGIFSPAEMSPPGEEVVLTETETPPVEGFLPDRSSSPGRRGPCGA